MIQNPFSGTRTSPYRSHINAPKTPDEQPQRLSEGRLHEVGRLIDLDHYKSIRNYLEKRKKAQLKCLLWKAKGLDKVKTTYYCVTCFKETGIVRPFCNVVHNCFISHQEHGFEGAGLKLAKQKSDLKNFENF